MKYKGKLIWLNKTKDESIHFERRITKNGKEKDYLIVTFYGLGESVVSEIPLKKVRKALEGEWEADQQERNERMKKK